MDIAVQHPLKQNRIDSKVGFTEPRNSRCQIDQTSFGRPVQHSECASDDKTQTVRFAHTVAFVHEDKICLQLQRQQDGVSFSTIQIHERDVTPRTRHRNDLEPRRCPRDPLANRLGRFRLRELACHRLRDQDLGIQQRQYFGVSDEDQVSKRRCVGNDNARHALQAKSAVSLAVSLQVLPGVFQPDLVLFQEPVQLVSRFNTQEAAKLRGCELAFTIRFESDGFEGRTGKVRTRPCQSGGKFVGKVEREVHARSIATDAYGVSGFATIRRGRDASNLAAGHRRPLNRPTGSPRGQIKDGCLSAVPVGRSCPRAARVECAPSRTSHLIRPESATGDSL
jgi:hypothetical protein